MRRGRDGVWRAKGRPRLARRRVRLRGEGLRADARRGRDERGHRPVLARADDELRGARCWSTSTTRSLAPARLAPAAPSRRSPSPRTRRIYELHVRDFSITDETVPAAHRGTYLAFTDAGSDGMRHLRGARRAGMNTLHLLPAFDIATIEEDRADQQEPACDLRLVPARLDGAAGVRRRRSPASDGFNWGYDPLHYTVPEGSLRDRTRRRRRAPSSSARWSQGINGAGLRVVMDVVYNHTPAAGQDRSRCSTGSCPATTTGSTATARSRPRPAARTPRPSTRMMEKLMVDSVVTWAQRVQGRRVPLRPDGPPLQGQHAGGPRGAGRADAARATASTARRSTCTARAGTSARSPTTPASSRPRQVNMAGTGIGTFSDRLRDAVRGGGPFDEDPRHPGLRHRPVHRPQRLDRSTARPPSSGPACCTTRT